MTDAPRAFVIGQPIAHTRSPLIHRHWLREYGIAGSYEAVEVAPSGLAAFVEKVRAGAYVGGNVTVPHKEAMFRLMAGGADDTAAAVGAVNTLYRAADGGLAAMNTDIAGFLANLDAGAPGWDRGGGAAVLLGAGGAARGIAYALGTRGVSVHLVNRSRDKAEAIAARLGSGATAHGSDSLPSLLDGASLLVNATSLGMAGKPPLEIDLAPLPRMAVVNDIVYAPLETALLAAARARGNPVVDGLGMLLHQAVPGFAHWFGVTPEVTPALRRVVLADLAEAKR
ncbi:MAG TPA: shikimate dehydrogenase [Hyphomicrobiales bacterium]|nr:shikimate dehydrogenase [Hyphomicrobiales bacterium]